MNTALKHWKEAATIIIAAGTKHKLGVDRLSNLDKANPVQLASNSKHNKSAFDYNVLTLKRSSESGFMPNAYVFPGGLVEPSDFSSEWLDIFKAFRNKPNFGLGMVKQPADTRPPMFSTDRRKLGSPIQGEVAFRICAVRETFEESGVLLVVPKLEEINLLKYMESNGNQHILPPGLSKLTDIYDTNELAKWRTRVNEDPSNFIKMCKELEVLPNIWALHEWSNWLTPIGLFGKQRRYDTAFFICCLQDIPFALQDQKEIVHIKWSTPQEVIHSYSSRKLWIAPPQFYDLSRLCRLPSLRELHSFASQRATEGCERWLPVLLHTDDSYISLLPGDKLYPEDSQPPAQVDKDVTDLSGPEPGLHRLVFHDRYTVSVQVTVTPKYNHLMPFQGPDSSKVPSSPL